MKRINHNKRKRFLLIVSIVVLFVIFSAIMSSALRMKNYDQLLDADIMNVYSDNSLFLAFETPRDIMDVFADNIVGVGVIDISQLGIKKSDLTELYTLEFIKNNQVMSTIEMLTPQHADKVDKTILEWLRKFNGKYVIMHENTHYFIFGKQFYDNLSELLTQ